MTSINPPGTGPLTPAEVSYVAEVTPITVIPRKRIDRLDLISGTIRDLRPPHRSTIPLWLAIVLKKERHCNILAPPWLNSGTISSILTWETENESFSPDLPFHWLEVSELLLKVASDDIDEADGMEGEMDLRVLLRSLREVRQQKAREGLRQNVVSDYVQMNGLGVMEITELRGFTTGVIDGLRRINTSREDLDEPVKPRGRGYAEGSPELGTAVDLVDPVDPVDPVGPSAEPNFNTQERDSEYEAAAPLSTAALRALKNKGKELEDLLTESETEEELSPLKSKGKGKDKGMKVASAMKEGSDSLPEDFQVQTKKSPKATYSRRTRKQTVEETPQPQGTKRHRLDSDVEHEEDAPRRAKKRVRNDQDESFKKETENGRSKSR